MSKKEKLRNEILLYLKEKRDEMEINEAIIYESFPSLGIYTYSAWGSVSSLEYLKFQVNIFKHAIKIGAIDEIPKEWKWAEEYINISRQIIYYKDILEATDKIENKKDFYLYLSDKDSFLTDTLWEELKIFRDRI